jgi:hypothetical protein
MVNFWLAVTSFGWVACSLGRISMCEWPGHAMQAIRRSSSSVKNTTLLRGVVLLIKSYYKITCAIYMYPQARSIDTIAPVHLFNITII